jgi:ABC-type branched-subunit amino acid transport system ATPase component
MGLANLSRSRTETPFALEVWDEPTKGMAQQGVQDLLEALKTRAEQERRPIWIVDHNTLGFNGFSGQVCVVKKDGRSRFEWV